MIFGRSKYIRSIAPDKKTSADFWTNFSRLLSAEAMDLSTRLAIKIRCEDLAFSERASVYFQDALQRVVAKDYEHLRSHKRIHLVKSERLKPWWQCCWKSPAIQFKISDHSFEKLFYILGIPAPRDFPDLEVAVTSRYPNLTLTTAQYVSSIVERALEQDICHMTMLRSMPRRGLALVQERREA